MKIPSGPFLEVRPTLGPPDSVLIASPSKSATHRAIILGTLSPHAVIDNPLISEDTVASLRLAAALGARTSAEPVTEAGNRMLARLAERGLTTITARDEASTQEEPAKWEGLLLDDVLARAAPQVPRPFLAAVVRLHIERGGARPDAVRDAVDLANSGTTMRLGTAVAALGAHPITLSGDASLTKRPMGPLAAALEKLGAKVECRGTDGRPPVRIHGPLRGGATEIRGDVSSQFVSALLIAAQGAPGPVEVKVTTPLKSAPYVDVTCAAIRAAGGAVTDHAPATPDVGPTYSINGPIELPPVVVRVPGDYSSAAFPLVAAAITGGRISLAGLDPDAPQGDRIIVDVLHEVGCVVKWEDDPERPGGHLLTVAAPNGSLQPFTHSFRDTPDLFPPLAVLAARCRGTSHLVDAAHVRLKECDRVAAMAAGLTAVGIDVEESPDALAVHGLGDLPVMPAAIETHDDHRILMAFTVLGLCGPGPLYLTEPGCYHVSYPRFRLDVDALGGETRVVGREDVLSSVPDSEPEVVQ